MFFYLLKIPSMRFNKWNGQVVFINPHRFVGLNMGWISNISVKQKSLI
jgi:hypothetical protein